MFGDHFYHAVTRKSVAVFGTIFNNISIARRNAADEVINAERVPLAYGPRQKFISRILKQPADREMAIKLPRMSFEIVDLAYDPNAKQNRTSQITRTDPDNPQNRQTIQLQTAYKMSMELNIIAKNTDEGLQILEQILPYFQPEYSVTIKPIDGWEEKVDIPITLESISINDDYEGDFTARRVLIYTLTFNMPARFYGPTTAQGLIKHINVDFYNMKNNGPMEGIDIKVTPHDATADDYEVTCSIDPLFAPDEYLLTVDDADGFAEKDAVEGITSGTRGYIRSISGSDITVHSADGQFEVETITTLDSPPVTAAVTNVEWTV